MLKKWVRMSSVSIFKPAKPGDTPGELTPQLCDVCSQDTFGVAHCSKCHENFFTSKDRYIHISGKTGGCHDPLTVGMQSDMVIYRNDYGYLQWSPWGLPEKEEK